MLANVDVEILLKALPDLTNDGIVQQAIQLLPFIPNIFIKLGPRGVLSVRLCPKNSASEHGLRLPGTHSDICVQHYSGLKHRGIVSVTGAGYGSIVSFTDLGIPSLVFFWLNWHPGNQ